MEQLSSNFKVQNVPKTRVELHIHIDGSVRPETLWELLKRKSLPMPGDGSLLALRQELQPKDCKDLCQFLRGFEYIVPALQADLDAIQRVAREFVEDRSADHIAYCEARFSPHILVDPPTPGAGSAFSRIQENGGDETNANGAANDSKITSDDVVEAVLKGFTEGENSCPGTKVRLLLTCMKHLPGTFDDVLRLCEAFKSRGVVGMDIAGLSSLHDPPNHSVGAEVFAAAAAKGIHRTVHAGEDAGPESVKAALDDLKAERIGHGYRVIEDEAVYAACRDADVHFEVCPHSSYYTGTIRQMQLPSKKHPVIRFAEDEVSFSINTDDTTITDTSLSDEYDLLRSWGFTEAHFVRANFNAALRSFLPVEEKQALIQQLKDAYGVLDYTPPRSTDTPSPGSKAISKPTITFNTWANRA